MGSKKRTHVFEMGSKKERVFFKWVVKRTHVCEMDSKIERMFVKWIVKRCMF
jgi:hypothetical protein